MGIRYDEPTKAYLKTNNIKAKQYMESAKPKGNPPKFLKNKAHNIIKLDSKANVDKAVKLFKGCIVQAANKEAFHNASAFKSLIVTKLKKQSYYKVDSKTSISADDYTKNINVMKTPRGFVVGLPDKKYKKTNFTYNQLASLVEFGGKNTNPNPLWRNSLTTFVQKRNGKKIR